MKTQPLALPLLILVVIFTASSKGASRDDDFYSVERDSYSNYWISVHISVIGRGIDDSFTFKREEDKTVFNNNQVLVVGNKLFTDKPGIIYIINNGHCAQRNYTDQPLYESDLGSTMCDSIINKMMDTKEMLFNLDDSGDYNSPTFQTTKKESNKRYTIKIIGNGVRDQFTFDKDVRVYDNINGKFAIENKLFSGTKNSLIIFNNGKCTERTYNYGKIIQSQILSSDKCDAKVSEMKKIKDKNGDPDTFIDDSSNKRADYDIDKFIVTKSARGEDTLVEVIGHGIKDKFHFKANEDTSVHKTNDVLVIGNRIFSSGSNDLVEILANKCIMKVYKEGKLSRSYDIDFVDCLDTVMKLQITKESIPINEDNSNYDAPFFTVKKGNSDHNHIMFQVKGNGVWDSVVFSSAENTNVYTKGNVLAIGERVFTDKPNTLTWIGRDGQCMQKTFVNGLENSNKALNTSQCGETKSNMSNFKKSNPPISNLSSFAHENHIVTSHSGGNREISANEKVKIIGDFIRGLPKWLQTPVTNFLEKQNNS